MSTGTSSCLPAETRAPDKVFQAVIFYQGYISSAGQFIWLTAGPEKSAHGNMKGVLLMALQEGWCVTFFLTGAIARS